MLIEAGLQNLQNSERYSQYNSVASSTIALWSLISAAVFGSQAFTVLQILWISLVRDIVGAAVFASQDVIVPKVRSSFDNGRFYVFLQVLIQFVWLVVLQTDALGYNEGNGETMTYLVFVLMQLFAQLTCLKLKGQLHIGKYPFVQHPIILGCVQNSILVTLILVNFGGSVLRCSTLTWTQNAICVAIGASTLIVSFVR